MSLRRAFLHNPYLVGNGAWCSCCFPNGPPSAQKLDWRQHIRPGCNERAGQGRHVYSAEEIVARTVAEARSHCVRAA